MESKGWISCVSTKFNLNKKDQRNRRTDAERDGRTRDSSRETKFSGENGHK